LSAGKTGKGNYKVIHRYINPDRLLFMLGLILAPAMGLAQTYTITTVYGTCSASGTVPPCLGGYGGDGGAASGALFNGPSAVIFDSTGDLYIADTNNNRIREVSPSGTINTVAGNGTAGFAGDGSSATASGTELNSPSGLTFDSKGDLFIADSDNFEIREVVGGTISTAAGKNSLGAGFAGDLGPATDAQLWNPTGVAVDSASNIYIADPQNNVVRVVCQTQTPIACTTAAFVGGAVWAAGDINTFAGNNTQGPGYTGDGGLANGALLSNPYAVILDPTGNLYISDNGNCAIRKVNTNGIISTIAGLGPTSCGYSGDGGQATQAALNYPKDIALDANGNLYIADSDNCVVRMVEPGGVITTIAGNNSTGCGYTGDGGAADSAQLYFPSGVAVNGGKVYIADNGNNVIRMLTPVAQVPTINAGGVVNDGNYTPPVAPGSIAAVFGDFFLTSASFNTALPLVTTLQNLSFDFGGTQTPLYFVAGGQADIQVPWELANQSSATLTATLNTTASAAQTVKLAAFAPAIFTTNSQGTGAGAITDSSFNLISAANPAIAGTTTILIYCTGLGPVNIAQTTGSAAPSNPPADTTATPTVTIGGIPATPSFSGLAPGFVGLYQVNALVPAGVASGSAVPVTISIGSPAVTSNTATIVVQ
jgi:uncharacterized protein (TIGR03437 family)